MTFDRILFSAAFVTIVGTAVLGVAQSLMTPAATQAPIAAQTAAPLTLERVVVVGQREPNGI